MSIQLVGISKYLFSRKVVIFFFIIVAALIVLAPLLWLFEKIQNGWGQDAAIVVLTLTFIVVIIIVAGGMGIGLCVDCAIRRRKFIFRSPQSGNWIERTRQIWGHNMPNLSDAEDQLVPDVPDVEGTMLIISEPLPVKAKRRGRRPTFPLPRWMEVALVWELRDPIFDTFTLSDVISQKLGTAANGEPIIGDGAYYATWRILAIQEINRLGLTSRPLSEDLQISDKLK